PVFALGAQTPAVQASSAFDTSTVMIPMRDGVRLHTRLLVPKNLTTKLPFILTRTPYGIGSPVNVGGSYAELAEDGYIFVYKDIRGRFASEGQFVMLRPPR